MRRVTYCAILSLPISLGLSAPAYAYLDPGTGSIILQSAMGAVAGALIFGRSHLQRLKEWVGHRGRKSGKPDVRDASE